MKIEKLTENKIRVIINSNELGDNNVNLHNIMTKSLETQDIFSNILKKAEKEVDFHTDGCKLLIEAFSSLDDVFVFTITRYLPDNEINNKKKIIAKRKTFKKPCKLAVCEFQDFEVFCDFCNNIKSLHSLALSKIAKNIALYFWKDSYYLVLKNISPTYDGVNLFFSTLSEFGRLLSCSEHFEFKLIEHGKVLIKKNAIDVGINFFVN